MKQGWRYLAPPKRVAVPLAPIVASRLVRFRTPGGPTAGWLVPMVYVDATAQDKVESVVFAGLATGKPCASTWFLWLSDVTTQVPCSIGCYLPTESNRSDDEMGAIADWLTASRALKAVD